MLDKALAHSLTDAVCQNATGTDDALNRLSELSESLEIKLCFLEKAHEKLAGLNAKLEDENEDFEHDVIQLKAVLTHAMCRLAFEGFTEEAKICQDVLHEVGGK